MREGGREEGKEREGSKIFFFFFKGPKTFHIIHGRYNIIIK